MGLAMRIVNPAMSRMAVGTSATSSHGCSSIRGPRTPSIATPVSASPIPGNEESVSRTIDNLFKAGANVFYHTIKRAHVSGHASQEELKLMLGLTKPRHFIPMHGEFRMLVQHGRLAIETGVLPENVFIIENGTPIEFFADGSARRATPVAAGLMALTYQAPEKV